MSRKNCLTLGSMLMTAAVLALGASSASAAVFSDGTFINSNWTHSILWQVGTVTLGTCGQILTGGDPNEYQAGRHICQASSAIIDGHLFVGGGSYNPATQGAIATMDVSYAYRDTVGYGTQNGLLIVQGPRTFIYYVDSSGPYSQWTNLAASGIIGTWSPAWVEVTGGVITNFTAPDFSSSGLPMTFGYYTLNQSVAYGIVDSTWGVDNFKVTVHTASPVPVKQSTWGGIKASYR